jgi:adenosyl cobinamide kinase/adenosyl cobinamide phosphate guanylyltransferase
MITLVLGGARSGKSEYAERLAASSDEPVTYVATATTTGDPDFAERINTHRGRRPPDWRTDEPGADLVGYLQGRTGRDTLLIDSLGAWVSSLPGFVADRDELCRALMARRGHTIVVSEEVGLGVHPSTEVGGRFRDVLGEVNQAVAQIADDAYLVVAGRALALGTSG